MVWCFEGGGGGDGGGTVAINSMGVVFYLSFHILSCTMVMCSRVLRDHFSFSRIVLKHSTVGFNTFN